MACCGRAKSPLKPAAPAAAPAVPAQKSISLPSAYTPPSRNLPQPPAPAGSYNPPGRFCTKCGWIVAVTKYADPVSHALIEKRTCTNHRCVNFQ